MAWKGPKWVSSWHNFAPEVLEKLHFPKQIEICDMTLEGEGEEMPGMVFTRDDRIQIAKMLDGIGVHRIDAGWITSYSPEDIEHVREISHLGLAARVSAYVGPPSKSNIDLALKADVWDIWVAIRSSDLAIEERGLSKSQVVERAVEVAAYAKDHGLNVRCELMDAARAKEDFARQFIDTLETQAKVDSIGISDSFSMQARV